jgi:DnaJ-class molecular chaperone
MKKKRLSSNTLGEVVGKRVCSHCTGTGEVSMYEYPGKETCPVCEGKGYIANAPLQTASGTCGNCGNYINDGRCDFSRLSDKRMSCWKPAPDGGKEGK